MKQIKEEDIVELRKEFDNYTKTAEQHEYVILAMVDVNFRKTQELIKKGSYKIEDNQKDLRAMFRVVKKVMHKDFSDYVEGR